jgi:hypothetical protein
LHMANSRYPIFQTYTPRFAKVLRSPWHWDIFVSFQIVVTQQS